MKSSKANPFTVTEVNYFVEFLDDFALTRELRDKGPYNVSKVV